MILNAEQLEQQARKLALTHNPDGARRQGKALWKSFHRDMESLRKYAALLKQEGAVCSQPAEEWLLDHADFMEEQALSVRRGLGGIASGRLPMLRGSDEWRATAICREYLSLVDGAYDEDTFAAFVNAYQEAAVLTIAECWSFPVLLRVALIRRYAAVMRSVRERRKMCEQADAILEPLFRERDKPDGSAVRDALEKAGIPMPLSGGLIVYLASRLNEWTDDAAAVRDWLVCSLDNGAESLNRLITYEHRLQASYEVAAGNIIRSLRSLARGEWESIFEQICVAERTLREERAGTYALMTAESRHTLRTRVERLAQRMRVPENLVAERAVMLAGRHADNTEAGASESVDGKPGPNAPLPPRSAYVAYYLLDPAGMAELQRSLRECADPRRMPETFVLRRGSAAYFTLLAGLFAAALTLFAIWSDRGAALGPGLQALLLLALIMPAGEWAVTIAHGLIRRTFRSRPLLRYDYASGVAPDAATIVVVPVIWSRPEEADELADRLELHYLANRDPNIYFALLGDFADADEERKETDEAVLARARERIEALNRTYSDGEGGRQPFLLLQRHRKWNPSENVWMGWERKRGKLVEFVELLRGGKETSFGVIVGNRDILSRIRYVITLDADTQLPIGSAQRMIGTIHLPYNRPRLNAAGTRVAEGYGVLQPRIGVSYASVQESRLTRLWAGEPGIDPYAFAVSDPYQDALGQGIFTGKGIFDADVFARVLSDRIPDNRVLSHDLLEGGFLRGGLLADIELIDGHPASFRAHQRRLHRWVRGDWQLLCWLMPRVCDRHGRLKPVDLPALTRWQMIDNLRRSLLQPALYALLLLGMLLPPPAGGSAVAIALATIAMPVVRAIVAPARLVRRPGLLLPAAGQAAVTLAALPHQSALLLDAIGRTLFRLFVSKRRLLEWTSSAETERRSRKEKLQLSGYRAGVALTLLFAAAAAFAPAPWLRWTGLAIAVIWLAAPLVAGWLSRSPASAPQALKDSDKDELRAVAEEIWKYYEEYAGERDHWLPPDNVQIDPPIGAAHRTSPTNIGLMLASTLAARDFGFIGTPELIERVERTVGTIERMDKWCGHLYNWYDTTTLRPLPPVYVSTVDSGNFVAYLIVVKEGVTEWAARDDEGEWRERAERLAARIERLISDTDFRPLYDERTQLFALGYHAGLKQRETILYDLLASEARQASFLAIATGQVPPSHWFKLGRAMTRSGKHPTLMSWSGTMFEYLMPALVMRTYRNTIWDATYRGVVRRQIDYARQRGVPFGISESGYYAFDYRMNYQYRAFGVPGLGFQRGLDEELVVAPYATIMALPYAPREALADLRRMAAAGARGKYGYYEAIDYTEKRMPDQRDRMVVRSFMAHHLGMSMLTLGNLLLPYKMYDRFHRDKRVQAAELLLQERVPEQPAIVTDASARFKTRQPANREEAGMPLREFDTPHTPVPEVCVLSNGSYTTVVTNRGGGFSRYDGIAVSRWREDPAADPPGQCMYIRDVESGDVWSPAYGPCMTPSSDQRAQFSLEQARFLRRDGEIATELDICVSPESDAELRRLTLTNEGDRTRILEVTTYVELALAPPAADDAHMAFSKLFVQTEYDEAAGCLLAVRRSRTEDEQPRWAAHALIAGCEPLGPVEYETDRSSFIGRGHTLARPQGLTSRLTETVGAVLDPAFVMRRRVSIGPGERVSLFAATGVAGERGEAVEIVRALCGAQQAERTFQLAWTRSRIDLRHQRLTAAEATQFQTLAGRLLYPAPLRKDRAKAIAANVKSQSGLWPLGISGDLPIALVRIRDSAHLSFAAKMIAGHGYLRRLGLPFDLVLLNESDDGYQQDMQEALRRAIEQSVDYPHPQPGGVYLVAASQIADAEKTLLLAVARVTLRADGPSLGAQLRVKAAGNRPAEAEQRPVMTAAGSAPPREAPDTAEDPEDWELFNGWGGFSPDGKEYRIALRGGKYLPAPWSNVLANRSFGCLVTELGTGYTWWRNSREFKLTPWSNDPVLDPPGEACYIKDEETGDIWSPAPSPTLEPTNCTVAHGRGYTRFRRLCRGLRQQMTVFVPREDAVKIVELQLENVADSPRTLSVVYRCDWVLGVRRPDSAPHIVSEWDSSAECLLARNTYQDTFRDAFAFLHVHDKDGAVAADEPDEAGMRAQADDRLSYTADRAELYGPGGSPERPAGLAGDRLSNATGPHADSCGAIRLRFEVAPRSVRKVYVLLGAAPSREEAVRLVREYGSAEACETAFADMRDYWDGILDQIAVKTPDKEMDLLLGGWLLYQTLSCRMWARTGFYQAGGAYGFRDQLQDSLALLHTRPDLTRAQILLHAAHQYEEGDVQHWWHDETGRGIRTRYSDDLLWLPYAVSRYIAHTGDESVLDVIVPYLHSPPLEEHEHERYEETVRSPQSGTVYEHCWRAIERAYRLGENGMPLMGIGDWNDGMNSIGDLGRGESVWLGWFLCDVLERFAAICELRGEAARALTCRNRRQAIADALNERAWDGEWYRRARADEGHWIGSNRNEEARIDAIAQSWSVISGAAPRDRALKAMRSFDRELVDRGLAVARLLTPPFDRTDPNPGYIQGYPPGIRENGAQYTHGVIWSVVAWCMLGDGNKAAELFHMLNPLAHARSPGDVRTYAGEPYVMAADVYTSAPHEGRAGWTWYTGSSGWMYQAGIEWILGLRREGGKLIVRPCIPDDWPGYTAIYRFGTTNYRIVVRNLAGGALPPDPDGRDDAAEMPEMPETPESDAHIRLEGDPDTGVSFELSDDGRQHVVTVMLRPRTAQPDAGQPSAAAGKALPHT